MWPFKYVNDELSAGGTETPESKALEDIPPEPRLSQYEIVMSDPDIEEALL